MLASRRSFALSRRAWVLLTVFAAAPLAALQAVPSFEPRVASHSTALERTLWAASFGLLGYLAADRLDPRQPFGGTRASGFIGYAVGSVVGVALVTAGREGIQPGRLLRGSAIGVVIGLGAAWVSCDVFDSVEPSGRCGDLGNVFRSFSVGVALPLGISLGHGDIRPREGGGSRRSY